MIVRRTPAWKFYTTTLEGISKCKICGRRVTKRFSVEYREDSEPDIASCERERKAWLKQTHICNKCRQDRFNENKNRSDVISIDFNSVENIIENIKESQSHLNVLIQEYRNTLIGYIAIYNNAEYLINNIGIDYPCSVYIRMTQISKKRKWLLTNKKLNYYISKKDIIFTNEKFSDRENLMK